MKAKIVEKLIDKTLIGCEHDGSYISVGEVKRLMKKFASHLYSAWGEVYVWVKPEDELPPTHHIVIGIDNDGTTVAYLWWNKEDNIWRYGFEGDGNVHAPEPEFWLKQITRPTVSEERIKEMGEDFKEKFGLEAGAAFISGAQWAIKELNR